MPVVADVLRRGAHDAEHIDIPSGEVALGKGDEEIPFTRGDVGDGGFVDELMELICCALYAHSDVLASDICATRLLGLKKGPQPNQLEIKGVAAAFFSCGAQS